MKTLIYISLIIVIVIALRRKRKRTTWLIQTKPNDFNLEKIEVLKNGFGSNATGGEGGVKYYVKTEAHLRLAVNQNHARIIYIKGVIRITSELKINKDNISIIGVTNNDRIEGYGVYTFAKNFIYHNIHFAAGDTSNENEDSLGFRHGAEHGIIDKCIASFAVDENVDFWGGKNITIQNSVISHALRNSVHDKGAHSMGLLIGNGAQNITVYNNVFALNDDRHLRLGEGSSCEFINNVVYGHKSNFVMSENTKATIINNVYLEGVQKVTHSNLIDYTNNENIKVFAQGNVNDFDARELHRDLTTETEMPLYSGVEIQPTENLLGRWYKTVKPKNKYAKQIIKDIEKKRGQVIDSQTEIEL